MLSCLILTSCGNKTYYNSERGYGQAYFGEIKKTCDRNWSWCEDLLETARLAHHECRSTDGIRKEQRRHELVVNDTIVGSLLRTEWNVWDGKDGCYKFVSHDDREYNVKEKFVSFELGKPHNKETFVRKIIILDNSIITPSFRNQLRNFYDATNKKDEYRPLKTKGKYELYERKYLNKQPLFSFDEVIQEKIPITNYFIGEKITDQDVKNFASGLYSIQGNSIMVSKSNQKKVLGQILKDQDKKNRQCWFEEYEDMKLCHEDFFKSNSFIERRGFAKKYGPKRIYTKRYITRTFIDYPKVMVNGVMMRRGINYANKKNYERTERIELTDVKYLCKNSTIPDGHKIRDYNYGSGPNINYADELPDNYCVLD